MSGRLDSFHPNRLPNGQWDRIGPHARRYVTAAQPGTPAKAIALLNAVAQFLAWCENQGFDFADPRVFRPEVVEHFVANGCGHLSTGTRGNYRSQLRTVGELALGPEACPSAVSGNVCAFHKFT